MSKTTVTASPLRAFTISVLVLFLAAAHTQGAPWAYIYAMTAARTGHTATLLSNGKLLVAGGYSGGSLFLSSTELYDPAHGGWSDTGTMNAAHYLHTATLLNNGKVLVTGGYGNSGNVTNSAELYDPRSGTWTVTGTLNEARVRHRATLLANGKVLVEGGYNGNATVASAELYDPATGTWTLTGSLSNARQDHTATLLSNGAVLVTAGETNNGSILSSSELYDPVGGTWSKLNPLNHQRTGHTATLLPNGQLLVAGGSSGPGPVGIAELFNPTNGTWTDSASLSNARYDHTATLLPNGMVLIAGGTPDGSTGLSSTELYNPANATWTIGKSLLTARTAHTAALLANGRLLVAGGSNGGSSISTAELYDSSNGAWTAINAMGSARQSHSATLLPDGRVLVVAGNIRGDVILSSCELFDQNSGVWTTITSLHHNRYSHTATLLLNGQVLVVGGVSGFGAMSIGERLDLSSTNGWADTQPMATPRYAHTATLLPNGKVLVAGGTSDGITYLSSAELYDPASDTWTSAGPMNSPHAEHTATLLPDGRVLIAGGQGGSGPSSSAEFYNPASGTWIPAAAMTTARAGHTATVLTSGNVLIAGGQSSGGIITTSAEIYYPSLGEWVPTGGALNNARVGHTATLLLTGQLLVAGGTNNTASALNSCELYEPAYDSWTPIGAMMDARVSHNAILLPKGQVLVEGGYNGTNVIANAEVYDVGLGFNPAWQPLISSALSLTLGTPLVVNGSMFRGISEGSGGNGAQDSCADYPVAQLHSVENEQTSFLLITNWSTDSLVTESVQGFPPGPALVTAFVNGIPSTVGLLNITVSGPTITLTNPVNASVFGVGTNLLLAALAQDSVGTIKQVSFFANYTNLLAVVTNGAFNTVWTNVPVGDYVLTAVALDDQGLSSTSVGVTIRVGAINHAPSFIKGPDIHVPQNSGPQSFTNWATAISPGPPSEAGQQLTFILTNDNPALFSIQPALDSSGLLTFTPAANMIGFANVTVILKDNGGTAFGGQDTSPPQSFVIALQAVNQPPSFTGGGNVTVNENAGAQVIDWATAISPGPPDEAWQTVTFIVTNDNNTLFSVQPTINTNGTLTFTTATNANGIANLTVWLKDDGGTANGGQDTSGPQFFTITVQPVNQPPSFTKGPDVTVGENAGAQVLAGWATAISPGPPNEASQTVTFIVTNDNNALFSVEPAIGANGTLTFTASANATGLAHVTVVLHDNGGTANGGQDTSAPQFFTIAVQTANQPPSFTKGPDVTVNENAGAQVLAGWATAISPGPPDEASLTVTFIATNDNNALFLVQPAVSTNGTLTFTTASNASGVAHVTVVLKNSGGTANGGQDTSAPQFFTVTVQPVNQPPSFTKGPNVTVNENAGAQVLAGWATAISPGPPNEASQTLTFIVTNDNNALFSVQPIVSTNGTLSFTTATNAGGLAHVTVVLKDNGGTANGGQDTSAPQSFTITVQPVNQPPSFTKGPNVTVNENVGAQVFAGWATAISPGPPNEASLTVTFIATNDNNALFLVQPVVSTNGTLTFTTASNASGVAHVTVVLKNSGGTANGGQDTSAPQSFSITVQRVNHPPSFTKGADVTVDENAGAQALAGWATAISPGPPNEASQTLTFLVTNDNSALFSVQPAISTNGTLTFTTSTNVTGLANVTVVLKDNGGTANGGQDTSAPQSFVINVQAVNQPPSFTGGTNVVINENVGPQVIAGWATAISPGPPNEASQTVTFIVTNDNASLFSLQPAISTNGTLSFTTSTNSSGLAHVTVVLKDNGGTANGGRDTSAPQTFTITVQLVNHAPSFTAGPNISINPDAGPQVITGWATAISPGPPNEASQLLTFIVTNDNAALFSVQPAISTNGTLNFTTSAGASGLAHVTVLLKDNGGTANGGQDTSAPQIFTITVTSGPQPADVGIILGSADADPTAVTNDVSAVSLPTKPFLTYSILQRSELSFQTLSQYLMLVWYDPNGTQQLTQDEVALLKSVYTNGTPILFAGPNLLSSASTLSSGSQTAWQSLIHLTPTGAPATNGLVVPDSTAQGGPLLNGAYGPVGTFFIQTDVDQATVTPDADSLAQLNGQDVVVSFPSVNDVNQNQVRIVTQLFSLDSAGDTNSLPMRQNLFENAVCWLLQCGACSAVYPAFAYDVNPMIPETGASTTLTLSLGNDGECDGVGYVTTVQLANGLSFVSATSDFGRVTHTNQVVTLFGGRLPARQTFTFEITVVPQIPGWFTNSVYIQSGSIPPQSDQAVFEVAGSVVPQMGISLGPLNSVLLKVTSAQSGGSYAIQKAILKPDTLNLPWISITNFTFTPPEFDLTDQIMPTNSGVLYQVVPQP